MQNTSTDKRQSINLKFWNFLNPSVLPVVWSLHLNDAIQVFAAKLLEEPSQSSEVECLTHSFLQWLRHSILLHKLTNFQARNCLLSGYESTSQSVTIFSTLDLTIENSLGFPFLSFVSECQERGSVAAMDSDVALCISLSTSAISFAYSNVFASVPAVLCAICFWKARFVLNLTRKVVQNISIFGIGALTPLLRWGADFILKLQNVVGRSVQ